MSLAAQRQTAELIAFPRRGTDRAPAIVAPTETGTRPAPALARARNIGLTVCLVACSLALHAAVIAALLQPAAPLDGVTIPAIAVDIVLGDNTPAGVAVAPGQENAIEVKPAEVTELAVPAAAPERVEREQTAALESQQEQLAPTSPTAQPVEAPPAKTAPARRKPPAVAARPSASSGVGRGGSSRADPNYYGAVAAHLARYKRFPDDARSRGDHGRAQIRFVFDGRGQVTSVSLVRSSGSGQLDREAQAMVYRASPFPVPPDHRPQSFTVPVDFSIH